MAPGTTSDDLTRGVRVIRASEFAGDAVQGWLAHGVAELTHAPTGFSTIAPQLVELLPGESTGRRHHRGQEILIAVMDGRCHVEWGNPPAGAAAAGPGDVILVSPWTVHEESNSGPGVVLLALYDQGAGSREG